MRVGAFIIARRYSYVQINNSSATPANITSVSVQSLGSVPTNWATTWLGVANGVVAKIIGTGTSNGINYIDVAVSGTPIATSTINMGFEQPTQISAAQGQTWTESVFLAVTSGSVAAFGVTPDIYERDSGGAFLAQPTNANITVNGTLSRYSLTYTITNASTAYVQPELILYYVSGVAVNYTLRIGMPQLERGAFPTSVIPTYGSAVTRAADVFTVPVTAAGANGAWYTAGQGSVGTGGIIPYPSSSTANRRFVSLSDGTTSNEIILVDNGSGNTGSAIASGGVSSFSTAGSAVPSTLINSAIAYETGDAGTSFGGTTPITVGSGVVVPTLTEMDVGNTAGVAQTDGWITRVWYMPTRQPNASLASYTQ